MLPGDHAQLSVTLAPRISQLSVVVCAACESRKGHGLTRSEPNSSKVAPRESVVDLPRELDNMLPFLTYGVSVIPSGAALPFEVENYDPIRRAWHRAVAKLAAARTRRFVTALP